MDDTLVAASAQLSQTRRRAVHKARAPGIDRDRECVQICNVPEPHPKPQPLLLSLQGVNGRHTCRRLSPAFQNRAASRS
jgi:hypothetical protein